MGFSVNFGAFGEPFSVPAVVVDRHLLLCGAVSLKVLLLVLRAREPMEVSALSTALSLPESDIRDALNYWTAAGVLWEESGAGDFAPLSAVSVQNAPPSAPVQSFSQSASTPTGQVITKMGGRPKLTSEEIATLATKRPDINTLIHESQILLGDTLSPTSTEILVSLHSYAGMSVELILMVVQYCVSIDRRSARYIETTAHDWIDRGIDTFEKAEGYILELTKASEQEKLIRNIFQLQNRSLTPKEKEYANRWIKELSFGEQMISLARERALDASAARPFPYCDSVLTAWHQQGIKTPANVRDADHQRESEKPGKGVPAPARQGWKPGGAPPSPDRERYDRAHAELQQRRAKARDIAAQRQQEIYDKVPRIKEIEAALAKTGFEISKAVLGGGNTKALIEKLREHNLQLQEEREALLAAAGFPKDYLESPYTCALCEDKGYTPKGEPCQCLKELLG